MCPPSIERLECTSCRLTGNILTNDSRGLTWAKALLVGQERIGYCKTFFFFVKATIYKILH